MKTNTKLDTAIQKFKDFILSIDLSGTPGQDISSGIVFTTEDGGIVLNKNEFVQYDLCNELIHEAMPNPDLISKKALERLTQKAIISSIDPENKHADKTREQRIDVALNILKSTLLSDLTKFNIYYPIENLELDVHSITIGNVTFCIFDNPQLQNFYSSISESLPEEQKLMRKSLFDDLQKNSIFNHPVALISVEALDFEAAKIIARDHLQKTLDVIHFFVDLVFGKDVFVFLPGDYNKTAITIPAIIDSGKGGSVISNERSHPLFPLNLNSFVERCKNRNLGLSKASELLKKDRKNKLEERLFAAIRWSGRATIEFQREESFLLYAIALETIVLCDNDKDELNYRLRIRVAHLIGREPDLGEVPESRKDISGRVKKLYDIRSQIVHTGNYSVTDAELYEIRQMAKLSILHILNLNPFINMQNADELRDWFDREILK
jgi:hypothetical protein